MAASDKIEDLVTIEVDGVEINVPKGQMVVEAVKQLGIEIPIFCYHPRLDPVGMCRMCLIEVGTKQPDGTVRKAPKPQTACTLPATPGLVVYTDNPQIRADRKGVLEFLLINHPLDCPVCDRGGECPLQNNTQFYGPSTTRHVELKRHAPKFVPLGDFITFDLERCIQCGRCVRFTDEISGDYDLAFRFRGASMQPSTFGMSQFESKFSGNTIEICPVGALTSSEYRFRARPWDLETGPAICTKCSCGCNVWFDHRVGKLIRVLGRTNDNVNDEWTCDKGKFGHQDYMKEERLQKVLVRRTDRLEESTWGEAFQIALQNLKLPELKTAILVGPQLSNEAIYLAEKVQSQVIPDGLIEFRTEPGLEAFTLDRPEVDLKGLESQTGLCVIGDSFADVLPIAFLRIRKAWKKSGTRVVSISPRPVETDLFAETSLHYRAGTLEMVLQFLNGKGQVQSVSEASGIEEKLLIKAQQILKETSAPVLTTRQIGVSEGVGALQAAKDLAHGLKGGWNLYWTTASGQGAADLGAYSYSEVSSVKEVFEKVLSGEIKGLWLAGFDPFDHFSDRNLVRQALEEAEFVIAQGSVSSEMVNYASLVLPSSLPGEGGGSFTNLDGRIQIFEQILQKVGDSKADWQIFLELLMRAGEGVSSFSHGDVRARIAKDNPRFADFEVKSGLTPAGSGASQ